MTSGNSVCGSLLLHYITYSACNRTVLCRATSCYNLALSKSDVSYCQKQIFKVQRACQHWYFQRYSLVYANEVIQYAYSSDYKECNHAYVCTAMSTTPALVFCRVAEGGFCSQ